MATLEQLTPGTSLRGVIPDVQVTVVSTRWFGSEALELTYKRSDGTVGNVLVYRSDEPRLTVVTTGRPWSFDGDGALFRLVSEAQRIHYAHLFDPLLAVHTSLVDPLPHQITAVYEAMLPRQPLRFLLADDPGAGKTIMAGLLMKELIARGDLKRCLVVCPGSLAEQWQDELRDKFQLPFEILTNDNLEASRTGNWFLENDLAIARLDKLSRNPEVQQLLQVPECGWDLIVCDEAHKMSATVFGGETKYTKRYQLGQMLSSITRHFLLMSATPHNGKEQDFQLFMALLDGDRFEGRLRDGARVADPSDLMRRMVKENLVKFDGTPLFPERIAYTVPYKLSEPEAALYKAVTDYVREQFNRAEALQNDKRAGTVGFALTILQRRLASSPEAIYQSLLRRRQRLEKRLREEEVLQRGAAAELSLPPETLQLTPDEVEDLEDAPGDEQERVAEEVVDQATAARTIEELRVEIEVLRQIERLAETVRNSRQDTKWLQLAGLLAQVFGSQPMAPQGDAETSRPASSPGQKLVLFTEHRDTLNYLHERIGVLLGRANAIVAIHGGVGRQDRLKAQEAFKHDPDVRVLVATDAAGEGINLQRAHLMVNYDLPWNPNRLEQRFGRIHRIGQTEVCHLWNLVADETREGDVYRRLLDKLEEARTALGGQVFDVLGKLQFEGRPLRELLLEAIRYGERADVQARLTTVMDTALDRSHLQALLADEALADQAMDASRIQRIREDMERADARRLQPHYIESFFLEAFRQLNATASLREPRRYEVTHVPSILRQRDRLIGLRAPVLPKYERIAFDKSLVNVTGKPSAAFVCPGHPLLDAVVDLTIERGADLLRRGAVLVDERDMSTQPRVLFYVQHRVVDATTTTSGAFRVISQRTLYVERAASGEVRNAGYAPYLDYRPLRQNEPDVEALLARDECRWITADIEQEALVFAVTRVAQEHVDEVRSARVARVQKTERAVKERLTSEIAYWDMRASDLHLQEQAGKTNARLNSREARRRADELQGRLQRRLAELRLEAQVSSMPPAVLGGVLVVPAGLLLAMSGQLTATVADAVDTQVSAARARAAVMEIERQLGFEPVDRETEKLGYDIESRDPRTGRLRFIEVKGRVTGADTVTVTRNEILYSLNKPDAFILAIVEFTSADEHRVHHLRQPFQREPDFGVTSVNYDFAELLGRAMPPC